MKIDQNYLISPDATLRSTIEVIDRGGIRIALVVDTNTYLIGVVTDGDIRRALLNGFEMNNKVSEIMNTKPITVNLNTNEKDTIQLMKENQILAIPILDNKKVIGIKTYDLENEVSEFENPVFIMAGGFGERLRPLTADTPKPLLKIDERPLLEITLQNFINRGFKNFYISTHYLGEKIQDYFGTGENLNVSINYINEESPLGTAGSLELLKTNNFKESILICNGDILTNMNYERLLKFHLKNKSDFTLCVRDYEYQIPYGVINTIENKILSIDEKPTKRFFINAGIYICSPSLLNLIDKDEHIDMTDLITRFLSQNINALMFPIHEYWLDIGKLEDYKRAQSDIANLSL